MPVRNVLAIVLLGFVVAPVFAAEFKEPADIFRQLPQPGLQPVLRKYSPKRDRSRERLRR